MLAILEVWVVLELLRDVHACLVHSPGSARPRLFVLSSRQESCVGILRCLVSQLLSPTSKTSARVHVHVYSVLALMILLRCYAP
ncbi:hypothetical protein P171DRAFT_228818 [Karstenula rhodostoma CBS 690.94]|uniref:Secreted protein n=1 Tax=Karstenula rhodostoma CBS 690.94 TaxID=1392251 RepID=A0A9P4PP69_9PLEO|nr:hypothetical protein P171DRAFT_228818 [Karstenula rhodostoma CBS 690.94]